MSCATLVRYVSPSFPQLMRARSRSRILVCDTNPLSATGAAPPDLAPRPAAVAPPSNCLATIAPRSPTDDTLTERIAAVVARRNRAASSIRWSASLPPLRPVFGRETAELMRRRECRFVELLLRSQPARWASEHNRTDANARSCARNLLAAASCTQSPPFDALALTRTKIRLTTLPSRC